MYWLKIILWNFCTLFDFLYFLCLSHSFKFWIYFIIFYVFLWFFILIMHFCAINHFKLKLKWRRSNPTTFLSAVQKKLILLWTLDKFVPSGWHSLHTDICLWDLKNFRWHIDQNQEPIKKLEQFNSNPVSSSIMIDRQLNLCIGIRKRVAVSF